MLYFLCRYFASFVPSIRMFPFLIIQFVSLKKINGTMKVYIKDNNTVRLRINIKCILTSKICSHSKYIVAWIWIWSGNEFGTFSSAGTLVSNALKLFIYYLLDQQIKLCMFYCFCLKKDKYYLRRLCKVPCVIVFCCWIDQLNNIMHVQQETFPCIFYLLVWHLYLLIQYTEIL